MHKYKSEIIEDFLWDEWYLNGKPHNINAHGESTIWNEKSEITFGHFQFFEGYGWLNLSDRLIIISETMKQLPKEYCVVKEGQVWRFPTLKEFLDKRIKEGEKIFKEVLSISFFCPICFKHISLNNDFFYPCSVCQAPNNFYDLVYGCKKCNIKLSILKCPHCDGDIELNYLYDEYYIRRQLQK